MSALGTIGNVQATFSADTQQFDTKVGGSSKVMDAAAKKAEQLGQKVVEMGSAVDRAASVQERAMQRAQRAWQQELIQQERAIEAQREAARAKELSALKADILSRSLEKEAGAQAAVNAATEHSIPQTAAASAAIRTLEGGMNNNVRAAERFLSTTLGLGPVLQALFPIAGGLAFMEIIGRMGEKVMELAQNWGGVKDAEEAAMKALQAADTEGITQAQEHAQMVLREQIANVGIGTRPQERGAAEASVRTMASLADAKTRLDDLNDRVANAQKQIQDEDLVKRSQQKRLVTNYGTAPGPFDPTKNPVPVYEPTTDAKFAEQRLRELRANMSTDLGARRDALQEMHTLTAEEALRRQELSEGQSRADREEAQKRLQAARQQLEAIKAAHSVTLEEEAAFWQKLADGAKRGSALYNAALMEANKARAEIVKQTQQAVVNAAIQNLEAMRAGDSSSDRISAAVTESWTAAQRRDEQTRKQLEESASRAFESAEQQRKAADRIAEESIRLQVASGQLSREAGAQALQRLHEESFAGFSAAAASFSAQFPNLPVPGAAQAVRDHSLQSMQDQAAAEASTALGALRESADKLTQQFLDLPAHLQQLFAATVSGFNNSIASAITSPSHSSQEYRSGILNALGGQFRSVGSRDIESALQLGEGALFSTLGFGKATGKPDGSQSNPLWVRLTAGAAGSAASTGASALSDTAAGSMLLAAMGARGAAGTSGASAGSFLSTVLPEVLTKIPFMATGGSLSSNMPAIVGERGPELFVPSSAGRIVPNDALGGGTADTHLHIDARGATDPAATEMSIHRALRSYDKMFGSKVIATIHGYNRGRPGTSKI
jgi:hypothetical protein